MSARCPEGHLSESLDYCDVCGSPMGAAPADDGGPAGGAGLSPAYGGAAPGPELPAPDATAQAATQTCPHCGALNVADALFCESCGYDFTTGTPPMGADPAPAAESDAAADPAGEDGERAGDEQSSGEGAPRDPVASPGMTSESTEQGQSVISVGAEEGQEAEESDGPASTDADQDGHAPEQAEASAPVLSAEPAPDAPPAEPAQPAVPAHRKARHTPPSRTLAEAWVVELWVDPDWYAVQQTEEACPSAGVPDIVLLTRSTALVGRPSGSLGVRPEVDAGADSAVSRRHAQLTSDGQRWWVEDLGSSNGTFVGTVGEPLPTEPIPPGQRVEIDRDDRLYVGAWTRIVLRQATESERQGTG